MKVKELIELLENFSDQEAEVWFEAGYWWGPDGSYLYDYKDGYVLNTKGSTVTKKQCISCEGTK